MKNKKVLIALVLTAVIIGIMAILLVSIFASGNNMAIVRCYVSESGAVYMVYHGRLVGINYVGKDTLSTGDNLFVIFNTAFAESYPERTQAKLVIKLSDGALDDVEIDDTHREQLEELGFVFE